ncbi:MAG: FHA domain-containing serine/threonine-protein kinase [Planctomycetota bacterium]
MSGAEALFLTSDHSSPVELPRKGKLVIGSDPDRAHLVVDAPGVDALHCAIGRLKSGGWAVQDLGAGTRLDGESIQTAKLAKGAVLEIGEARLRVVPASALDAGASGEPVPPPAAPAPRKSAPKRSSGRAQRAETPRALGGYALESQLGSGAMGDVWLATQTSLDRKVALKLLKSKLAADARFVDRFRTEARAAARLNHPNIVTAFDVGEDGGHHFLSMEYMEGGSLQAELQRLGRLAWPDAMRAVADAAAGLVYAESQGIVHRDIKPENLMRGEGGTVKIADLGLAVQVEQEDNAELGGKVFGTPHFLAPELLRGEAPTTRSDLYALGTTAYQLVAGRPPFDGADARSIARKILNDEPPQLGAVVQGVPAGVERVVHRLMAKEPDARPATAQEALDELRSAAGGGASGGGARRIAIAVGALALAGAGAFAVLGGDPPEDQDAGTEPAVVSAGDAGTNDPRAGDPGDGGAAGASSVDPGDSTDPDAGNGPPTFEPGDTSTPELDFEAEAADALAAIEDEALDVDARVERLLAHAERFRGSDAARRAAEAAAALRAEDAAATEAESALGRARSLYVEELRAAASTDSRSIAAALSGLSQAAPPGPELVEDTGVREARTGIATELLERAAEALEAELAAADTAEEALDYAATGAALQRAVTLEVLPTPEELPPWLRVEPTPPELVRVRFLVEQAEERFGAWSTRSAEFEAERVRRERTRVAQVVGQRLETSLAGMDVAAAAERLRAAANESQVPALATALRTAADHLVAADGQITALFDAWESEGWKRVTLRDPRGRDGRRVDVVGVAPERALLLEAAGGGAPETVPFELFGGHTDALADLLEPRTSADRSAEDEAALAELLAATASLEVARAVAPLLEAEGRTFRFGPEDSAATLAPFEVLKNWRASSGAERIAPHRKAAEELCRALEARGAGDLAAAAEYLDRLLETRRSSYIVLILSDGGRE